MPPQKDIILLTIGENIDAAAFKRWRTVGPPGQQMRYAVYESESGDKVELNEPQLAALGLTPPNNLGS